MIDPENFISLLYYFGLLTIDTQFRGTLLLTIPNEVIKQLYYEYIREGYRDTKIFNIDLYKLGNLFSEMAYTGKWEDLFLYLSSEMNKQTSLRDYINGEKAIQTFIRVYLNVSNYYITKSEQELNKGYGDIVLIPNLLQYPDISFSYIIEVKYMSVTEYSEKKLEDKINEARKELKQYEEDDAFWKFKGRTDLLKIILVFCGVELKYKELFL